MKLAICLSFLLLAVGVARADGLSTTRFSSVTNKDKASQVGVGVALGSLNGVTGQYWITDDRALNATLAAERGNAAVSLAHVWMFRRAFVDYGRSASYFVPYVGVGAITAFGKQTDYFTRTNENVVTAAQAPIGIEFLPVMQRFDVFAELAPSLELSPTSVGFLTGDLGARFYF